MAQTDAIVNRLKPFTIISSMRERTTFPADLLQRLTYLKLLLATGTRFDTFDLAVAKDLGITVAAAPRREKVSQPTTQHTLAMTLARNTQLAKGLTGTKLGVAGLDRLGAAVARIGALICLSAEMGLPVHGGGRDADAPAFITGSKEELFRNTDMQTLHYVLTLLVNTSRGPLIDDVALFDALHNGRIGDAALDVFDRSRDWGHGVTSNLQITPHMGYVEEGIMHTWYEETVENIERWIQSKNGFTPPAMVVVCR
ncbi:hypothetical protein BGW36DRAFT_450727 [Talaromyces proteolyticus]|uniref:D-isomer specific 2-hydroxyacid dehydrogenase NAD-binding domain-containing protein n=1 Tax=Talaromyces proteolyticus TaxID=1131652 RepID=A0AAD4KS27_9EURO|nr:uncharacterized protein BGW36DRAFT_450727 [Talaromyces proteolyticus]KAH8697955.1 hypothetical protein BGW36DRAFT_450727 [Talaromyces proteolyticus]